MLRNNIHHRKMDKLETTQILKNDMIMMGNFIEKRPKSSLFSLLPTDLSKLANEWTELTELEISDKNFEDLVELTELLNLLRNLRKLIIHNNILQALPSMIGTLENLCIINLSHNRLTQLPDDVSKLKNLEELDLSFNELTDLPKAYSKLQRLKTLNLSNNKFNGLPKCIQNGMGTLRVLDISENPKVRINVTPYSKYLEKFYASGNANCCKFPDWLLKHKFFNLKEFNLDRTTFEVFSFIGNEGKLYYTSISMRDSNLSDPILNMIVENMINLEIINVGNKNQLSSGNIFSNIPINTLRNPGLITELNFRATSLSVIPADIRLLSNLKKLDIGLNNISWFPQEFCQLLKLESLIMDENSFILFPEDFGKLESLRVLKAENNDISKLPDSFANLKNLRVIDMYNNSFDEFPSVLFEISSIEYLDFDQNFCIVDNIMLRQKSYSALRKSYLSSIERISANSFSFTRMAGNKKKPYLDSDSEDEKCFHSGFSDQEDNTETSFKDVKMNDEDENWEFVEDPDDNYKPNDTTGSYLYRSRARKFLPPLPDSFCPADLHSKRIKTEVTSMRIHGSLPSFEIECGQFDDA